MEKARVKVALHKIIDDLEMVRMQWVKGLVAMAKAVIAIEDSAPGSDMAQALADAGIEAGNYAAILGGARMLKGLDSRRRCAAYTAKRSFERGVLRENLASIAGERRSFFNATARIAPLICFTRSLKTSRETGPEPKKLTYRCASFFAALSRGNLRCRWGQRKKGGPISRVTPWELWGKPKVSGGGGNGRRRGCEVGGTGVIGAPPNPRACHTHLFILGPLNASILWRRGV